METSKRFLAAILALAVTIGSGCATGDIVNPPMADEPILDLHAAVLPVTVTSKHHALLAYKNMTEKDRQDFDAVWLDEVRKSNLFSSVEKVPGRERVRDADIVLEAEIVKYNMRFSYWLFSPINILILLSVMPATVQTMTLDMCAVKPGSGDRIWERSLSVKKKLLLYSNKARYEELDKWAPLFFAAARVDLMEALKKRGAPERKPALKEPAGAPLSPQDILESLESE